ncbi:hypothetical protein CRUP_005195 [Coryphaenoides rupestris]|nr:hypothetical protein CRUP_005195 [Coryphaenoides rupestris]
MMETWHIAGSSQVAASAPAPPVTAPAGGGGGGASSSAVPSGARLNARFAFTCTVSLSFTYVCYTVIFSSSGAIMTRRALHPPSSSSSSSSSSGVPLRLTRCGGKRGAKVRQQEAARALIVGVKKGGTRAVLEFIRIHPDVRALGTEPHFFDRNYDRGLDWYR